MSDVIITVSLVGGRHKCSPNPQPVNPGDTVVWTGNGPVIAQFHRKSPFEEGLGPFSESVKGTVMSKPPLHSGDRFTAVISLNGRLNPTDGDIIVQ